jgi:polar amino acid transport system permease protein
MAEITDHGQPGFSPPAKSPRRESRGMRIPRIEVTDGALIPGKGEKPALSAWRIAFFGAIALLVALPIIKPDPYWKIIRFILPFSRPDPAGPVIFTPDGILRTLQVTVLSIFFSLFVGLITGIGRISRIAIVNRIATIYVEIIRGIPLLVQIFYIYYALAKIIQVPDITAAVIAMTVCYGAYLGEIFRAGIQSIPKGQMEAAIALGLSRGQALTRIILPQTMRVVLPPLGNEFIALLKDSSLVSILAVSDLLRRGREFASVTFTYFESYTVVALVYLIMTLFFSRLVGIMEERLNRRGR